MVVPDYWMLWCRNLCSLDLFSPFRSTHIQGLDSHSDLPPCPLLPLSFPSSCCYFCLLPLSPISFLFSPMLFSVLILPSSCIHLLSQGPCGTLRGGWGWWWCRWWWNSHSVSFVTSPTARSPFPLVSPSHLFSLILETKCSENEKGNKEEGFLSLPVSSTHHDASTPHHHTVVATHVCVDTALCLSLLTTNINPYCQNSIIHKQGQGNIQADKWISFSNVPRLCLAVHSSLWSLLVVIMFDFQVLHDAKGVLLCQQ